MATMRWTRTGWAWPVLLGLAAASWPAGGAAGQQGVARGRAALERCDAAAEAEDEEAADDAREEAVRAARALPDGREVEALVIRAQAQVRCGIPFAGFMRRGQLVEEANELLERALSMDPAHLGARFSLAVNHYHTPAFLGRTDDAVTHFERLLADHGRRDDRRVAMTYHYLGRLYARMGRDAEADSTWRLGAERFPEFEPLLEKVEELGPAPEAGEEPPSAGPGPSGEAPADPDFRLEPLVVEAGGYSMDDPRTATRLSKLDVYTLPGGTADVLQTFKAMPGVTQVTDGSDLYVRGGDPAESPIYVDGARLLHPGRFETLNGSMFGVLDPSSLEKAYFSSGGFSARYGNALSGIVDVETEGRPADQRLRLGANLATLGATAWQPITWNAGVWATGSFTETSALLELHGRSDEFPTSPRSYQGMAGAVLEPEEGTTLKLSGLVESDEATVRVRAQGYEGPFTSAATSRLITLSGRALNDAGDASLRVAFGASTRESGFAYGVLDRETTERAFTSRADAELDRGGLRIRAGLEASALEHARTGAFPASEQLAPGSPVVTLDSREEATEHLGGYGEVEGRVLDDLALVAGLRADRLPGEGRVTLDPRLSVAYRLDAWSLRVGTGVFSQGRWRARRDVPDAGRPVGVPLRARHLVAGVQHEGAVSFRAEAYLKDYDDYRPHPAAVGPTVADGRVMGVDALLRGSAGDAVTGWVTYSLLDGRVELEDGRVVPSRYDVTHTLTVVAKVAVSDAWEVGLTGRYATGRPHTPIRGAPPPEPGRPLAPSYGPLHSSRLPDYRRLDARLTRYATVAGRSVVAYLEGLNVLDRRNVMAYTYDETYRNPEPVDSFFADRTLVLGVETQL